MLPHRLTSLADRLAQESEDVFGLAAGTGLARGILSYRLRGPRKGAAQQREGCTAT